MDRELKIKVAVQETIWMKLIDIIPIRFLWKHFPNVTMARLFCGRQKVGELRLRQMIIGAN